MVRMWVDRSTFRPYPAIVQRLLPVEIGELNRLYQLGFTSWLPSRPSRTGSITGCASNGPTRLGRRHPRREPRGPAGVVGNVLTHVVLSRTRVRYRSHRCGDGRAAADLRPGRPECPVGQSAGDRRLSPSRVRRAHPFRGATHPPPRVPVARPAGFTPSLLPPRRETDQMMTPTAHAPPVRRHHDSRPRSRRRCPEDRVGGTGDARPAPDPRTVRSARSRSRASGSGRASTSRPRRRTSLARSRRAARK